jgi:hypothetical protein
MALQATAPLTAGTVRQGQESVLAGEQIDRRAHWPGQPSEKQSRRLDANASVLGREVSV